ncbi:MAG: hypothetical protein COS34_07400 [Lysobacterales bacterium CG02_land_8_20_14_3_00_62_12]|nr:MAG: hypothetical protein COS34_07400 [Xanthomonadales bacterium CG02_land_8_20_14_3_00_62_12]
MNRSRVNNILGRCDVGAQDDDDAAAEYVAGLAPDAPEASDAIDAAAAAQNRADCAAASQYYWVMAAKALSRRDFANMRSLATQARNWESDAGLDSVLLSAIFCVAPRIPPAPVVKAGAEITRPAALAARSAVRAEERAHADRMAAARKAERDALNALNAQRAQARQIDRAALIGRVFDAKKAWKSVGSIYWIKADGEQLAVDLDGDLQSAGKTTVVRITAAKPGRLCGKKFDLSGVLN